MPTKRSGSSAPLPRELAQLLGNEHVRSALEESDGLFASGGGAVTAHAANIAATGHTPTFNLDETLGNYHSHRAKTKYLAFQ